MEKWQNLGRPRCMDHVRHARQMQSRHWEAQSQVNVTLINWNSLEQMIRTLGLPPPPCLPDMIHIMSVPIFVTLLPPPHCVDGVY